MLIRDRNKHRRKHQKTGHPLHKLHRNLLTRLIQKRITYTRNITWQKQLEKANHTLWQTYKLTRRKRNSISPLIDPFANTTHYTDHNKAEAIAKHFVNIHNLAHSNSLPLDEIKRQSQIMNSPSESDVHLPYLLNITPHQIHTYLNQKATQQQSFRARWQNHGNDTKNPS